MAPPAGSAVLLRVEVSDTGMGVIDPDELFEAFHQADRSTTRRHGGTGLGLAISRQLVHSMGGEIGVRTRPTGGSVFWFTARLEVGVALPDSADDPLPPRRVLVVDGSAAAAAQTVRLLRQWSLEADVAVTADEALAGLLRAARAGSPYDQALVDVDLPGVDGLSLGRQIRARPELTGIDLVLLASVLSMRTGEVAEAGFRTWVVKPILHRSFRVALDPQGPAALEPAGPPRGLTGTPDRPRAPVPLRLAVLVVEDNPVNQLVSAGILEAAGCTVTSVDNGEEAVVALRPGHPFDVVIMDCRMPRLDGYEATRVVRSRERDSGADRRVPIIAMTASALPGERERCLAAGMDDFLTKPVDATELIATLVRWSPGTPDPATPDTSEPAGPSGAPRAPARELQVLDSERVAMLAELVKDGLSFFERTRSSFVSRIDGTLAALRIAVADGDLEQAGATAHQLKGSAANLGLERLAAAAAVAEEAAGTGDLETLPGAVTVVEVRAAEAVQALSRQ